MFKIKHLREPHDYTGRYRTIELRIEYKACIMQTLYISKKVNIMDNTIAVKLISEHKLLLSALDGLIEGNSIFCYKNGDMLMKANDIRTFLNANSRSSKRYVLAETEFTYEIIRMMDNSNNELFYLQLALKENPNPVTITNLERVTNMLDIYVGKSYKQLGNSDRKISEKMKLDNVITYAYLQRTTATTASFKNSKIGATKTLRNIIYELIKSKKLRQFTRDESREKYGSYADMYEIL